MGKHPKNFKTLKTAKIRKYENIEMGEMKMNLCVNTVFGKDIIGQKDLRNNLSHLISKAIDGFEEIISGNAKKGGKTASIISTDLLEEILTAYKFEPEILYDKATNQHEILLHEINVYGSGDTKEEAEDILVDLVIDSTCEFFESKDIYMRMPETKKMFPFYLRIRHCSNRDEIKEVLNLKKLT